MGTVEGYGYDKSALVKNYAATMSMYWPSFDPASYNAATYSNRALTSVPAGPGVGSKMEGGEAGMGGSPQTGSSPPAALGFTHTSPPAASVATAHVTPTLPTFPTPAAPTTHIASHPAPALASLHLPYQQRVCSSSTTKPQVRIDRKELLEALTGATPKKKPQPVPQERKDQSYWERRRRNNESARRSRESRRIKEDQTHYKLLYLENENLQLRTEVSMLRTELDNFRRIHANAQLQHPTPQQAFTDVPQ